MNLTEACEELGIHRNTAYKLIKDGLLTPEPYNTLKKRPVYRFRRDYIAAKKAETLKARPAREAPGGE